MELVLYSALLLLGAGLTWAGSDLLERTAGRLATRYRLPDLIRGTLVVAVGSSFPELSTTVISSLVHGEFQLGMATVVGSAVFNILVIPGLSVLLGKPLTLDLRLVYRDAQFYLTSVAVLLIAFSFALIYHPVDADALVGGMTRIIALVPLLLYGLYLFLQHQEMVGAGAATVAPPDPDGEAFASSALRDWLLLLLSLGLVVAGVEALLRTAIWLGDTLGTPSFLWGATVVAAVTSIPDAFVSVKSARRGEGDVSMGNVLGSNVFDLLVAIPAGVLVAGVTPIDFAVAAPLMGFLTLATIVLFTALRTDLVVTRREAWVLLGLYGVFVVWLGLETAGVVRWIG